MSLVIPLVTITGSKDSIWTQITNIEEVSVSYQMSVEEITNYVSYVLNTFNEDGRIHGAHDSRKIKEILDDIARISRNYYPYMQT